MNVKSKELIATENSRTTINYPFLFDKRRMYRESMITCALDKRYNHGILTNQNNLL